MWTLSFCDLFHYKKFHCNESVSEMAKILLWRNFAGFFSSLNSLLIQWRILLCVPCLFFLSALEKASGRSATAAVELGEAAVILLYSSGWRDNTYKKGEAGVKEGQEIAYFFPISIASHGSTKKNRNVPFHSVGHGLSHFTLLSNHCSATFTSPSFSFKFFKKENC